MIVAFIIHITPYFSKRRVRSDSISVPRNSVRDTVIIAILLVPDYEVSLEHLLLDLLLLCDGSVHFTIGHCTSQHFL